MTEHIKTDEESADESQVQKLCARNACPRYAMDGDHVCWRCSRGTYFNE